MFWLAGKFNKGEAMTDEQEFKPPYTPIPAIVSATTQLDALDRDVYRQIRAHKNDKTGLCNPSLETLAKETGLSVKTVARRRAHLVELGLLKITRGYQSSVEHYFPLDPPFTNPAETLTLMKALDKKDKQSVLGNWVEKTEDLMKSIKDSPVPYEDLQRTPQSIHKGLPSPTNYKNITKDSSGSFIDIKEPSSFDNDVFEKFWKAYPKRTHKGDAKKAWKKVKEPRATLQLILLALKWQKKSDQWEKDGGQFIPYPASYLNAWGWLDENPDARQEEHTPPPREQQEQQEGPREPMNPELKKKIKETLEKMLRGEKP